MWQIFDNSKIRLFVIKTVTTANDREIFYALMSFMSFKTANYANVADIRQFDNS